MSYISISKSFNAAKRNIILTTESLDKTLEYDMDAGTYMRWSPPTYMNLLVRPKFKSNIRWHVILLNTIGNLLPLSRNLKATSTFVIYLLLESCRYLLPLILSISTVSLYVVGIPITNFIFFLTLMATFIIINFLCSRAGSIYGNYRVITLFSPW